MNKTILQVPINKELKVTAEEAASSQGFSSLQEAVRLFLTKLAQGTVHITFEETVQLSKGAIKRYTVAVRDIEKGKNVHQAKNLQDLLKQLHHAS